MRGAALRGAALAGGLVAALLACAAATGWLSLVGAWRWHGAPVADVLPLDELSRRSSAGGWAFVAAWGAASLLLGLLARRLRLGRTGAGLAVAALTGLWCYSTTAASLLVVRQTSLRPALEAAWGLGAVLVPALLAGLAGALLGRAGAVRDRGRAPLVLAALVAAVGGVAVVDALLPTRSAGLLQHLAPVRVHPLASALVAPLGVALVVLGRGLARRKQRAWQAGVAVLLATASLDLLHSFDTGATVTGLVAIALVARRDDFHAKGDPAGPPLIARRAALLLAGVYAYGLAAIWINRMAADAGFSVWLGVREVSASLVGMEWNGSAHLHGEFGEWFGTSVFLAGLGGAALLLRAWLAPWRYRHLLGERERLAAHELVSAFGVDTLAPFALRADKSYFFADDERAFLAYRVVGGVAVVSGDPVGEPACFPRLLERFVAHARGRGWRIAVLGASEARLGLYRDLGLHALYHGDEAVLEVAAFSLEGRSIRKVRQSCHRLGAAGYRTRVLHAGEIGPELRARLEEVATAWRGDQPERGFTMALDHLFRLDGEDALFVIGCDHEGEPAGFLHFAVSRAGRALSLSTMPRRRDSPNGFNEWLVCEAVEWARANRVERISLNFAPFAALLAPEAELRGAQRLQRRALLALKGHFQLDSLLLFNRKFLPRWERRYVVYERRSDLPRVGLAALAAEAYLPQLRLRLPLRLPRRAGGTGGGRGGRGASSDADAAQGAPA